jgi:hypothetical protein
MDEFEIIIGEVIRKTVFRALHRDVEWRQLSAGVSEWFPVDFEVGGKNPYVPEAELNADWGAPILDRCNAVLVEIGEDDLSEDCVVGDCVWITGRHGGFDLRQRWCGESVKVCLGIEGQVRVKLNNGTYMDHVIARLKAEGGPRDGLVARPFWYSLLATLEARIDLPSP